MLQVVPTGTQYYERNHRPEPPQQRWHKGQSSFRQSPKVTQTKIGDTVIQVGTVYMATPRHALTDAYGKQRHERIRMIGAKNNRGEMMLCFMADDSRPYGGYLLRTFAAVTPLQ